MIYFFIALPLLLLAGFVYWMAKRDEEHRIDMLKQRNSNISKEREFSSAIKNIKRKGEYSTVKPSPKPTKRRDNEVLKKSAEEMDSPIPYFTTTPINISGEPHSTSRATESFSGHGGKFSGSGASDSWGSYSSDSSSSSSSDSGSSCGGSD